MPTPAGNIFTSNGIDMGGTANVIAAPKPSYTQQQVTDYLGGQNGQGLSYWKGMTDVGNTFMQSLGRTPDMGAREFYGQQISSGVPIAQIIANIQNSPEAQAFAAGGGTGTPTGGGAPPAGGAAPAAPRIQPLGSWRERQAMRMQAGANRQLVRQQRDAFRDQKLAGRDMRKLLRDIPPQLLQSLFGGAGQGAMAGMAPYQPPTSRSFMGPGNTPAPFRQMPGIPGQQMQSRGPTGMMPLPQNLMQYQPALMGNSMFAPRGQYQAPAPAAPNPAATQNPAEQAFGSPEYWYKQYLASEQQGAGAGGPGSGY